MAKYKETADRKAYLDSRRSHKRSELRTKLIKEQWAKEDAER